MLVLLNLQRRQQRQGLGGPKRTPRTHRLCRRRRAAHPRSSAADRVGEPSGSPVVRFRPANPARSVTSQANAKTVTSAKGDAMARKSRTVSSTKSSKSERKNRKVIPEPFQVVSSVVATSDGKKVEVPMLVLYGEWLRAV